MSPVNTDTSFIENRPPNVAVQFRDRVASSPDREAFRYPAGEDQPWTSMTWKETGDTVEKLAAGLLALGIQSEQRVGIASGTRVEWILADLADHVRGRRDDDGLPLDDGRRRRLHPVRLRVPRGLRRGRRPGRQAQGAQVRAAAPRRRS